MIFVKNSNFLHGLFLLKTGLAMTFGDIEKRPCLTVKNVFHIIEKLDILQRG